MAAPVFPTLRGLSWPVKRAPVFKNSRSESYAGQVTVSRMRILPRWAYELTFDLLRSDAGFLEFQSLLQLYLETYAGALLFAFNDLNDNTATNQAAGIGDGSTTQFEFVRTQAGFTEPIRAFNGTPIVSLEGTPTTAFTIDNDGLINFTSAPGSGVHISWSGQFYWLCRFDEDSIDLSQFTPNFWELKSLKFTTEILA